MVLGLGRYSTECAPHEATTCSPAPVPATPPHLRTLISSVAHQPPGASVCVSARARDGNWGARARKAARGYTCWRDGSLRAIPSTPKSHRRLSGNAAICACAHRDARTTRAGLTRLSRRVCVHTCAWACVIMCTHASALPRRPQALQALVLTALVPSSPLEKPKHFVFVFVNTSRTTKVPFSAGFHLLRAPREGPKAATGGDGGGQGAGRARDRFWNVRGGRAPRDWSSLRASVRR